jgi:hypothetical protein
MLYGPRKTKGLGVPHVEQLVCSMLDHQSPLAHLYGQYARPSKTTLVPVENAAPRVVREPAKLHLDGWLAFCRDEQGMSDEGVHAATELFLAQARTCGGGVSPPNLPPSAASAAHDATRPNACESTEKDSSSSSGTAHHTSPPEEDGPFVPLLGFELLLRDASNDAADVAALAVLDESLPLYAYFIDSSHNTYLVGNQLTGRSDADMYRRVLAAGCRCVEIDLWDGDDGEPCVTHGGTLTSEVRSPHPPPLHGLAGADLTWRGEAAAAWLQMGAAAAWLEMRREARTRRGVVRLTLCS